MTPGQLLDALLPYAHRWPFSITSGLRTPKRNEAVGGGFNSRHQYGLAFDLVPDGDFNTWEVLVARMKKDHPEWDVVIESDHVHVEWDPS